MIKPEVRPKPTSTHGNPSFDLENEYEYDDECPTVYTENMSKLLSRSKTAAIEMECSLFPGEEVVLRVFEKKSEVESSASIPHNVYFSPRSMIGADDDTISTIGFEEPKREKERKVWMEEELIRMENIEMISQNKNKIELCIIEGPKIVKKELVFGSRSESKSFIRMIAVYHDLRRSFSKKLLIQERSIGKGSFLTESESEDGSY